MGDIPGDKSKRPPECERRFIPFSDENPRTVWDNANATGRWTRCPHIKETYSGFDGERYGCDVCGKSYFLDYEDMK